MGVVRLYDDDMKLLHVTTTDKDLYLGVTGHDGTEERYKVEFSGGE